MTDYILSQMQPKTPIAFAGQIQAGIFRGPPISTFSQDRVTKTGFAVLPETTDKNQTNM